MQSISQLQEKDSVHYKMLLKEIN